MTRGFGRFLRRNTIALLALFLVLGGSSYAAATAINGKSIKPNSIPKNRLTKTAIKQLKGNRGLRGLQGARGATGAQGVQGVQGPPGPQGIISTGAFSGTFTTDPPDSTWDFIGSTTTAATAAGQGLVGSAEVPLYGSGTGFMDYGLCYAPSTGGALTNFVGGNYSTSSVTTARQVFSASAAVAPGAGTWTVGYCVRNRTTADISSDWVNGWVQVVNGPLSASPSRPETKK
jgi:hypothetical protein